MSIRLQELINEAKQLLATFEANVSLSASLNLTDIHVLSENFFRDLLNAVYGYNLRNINAIEPNAIAVDLGDDASSVCVQITSSKSLGKIRKTVSAFEEASLDAKYGRLVLVVLQPKARRAEVIIGNRIQFSTKRDVWDTRDILRDIADKPIDEIERVVALIRSHLSKPIVAVKDANLPDALTVLLSGRESNITVGHVEDIIASDIQHASSFDQGWHPTKAWSLDVLGKLPSLLESREVEVTPDELALVCALIPLLSVVQKEWIRAQFDDNNTDRNSLLGEVVATLPDSLPALDKLSGRGLEVVRKFAVMRVVSLRRRYWADVVFSQCDSLPEVGQAIARAPYVAGVLRASCGNVGDFDALPEEAPLIILDVAVTVRWKLVACVLAMAQRTVFGFEQLPADIVHHAVRDEKLAEAITTQASQTLVRFSRAEWKIIATCDEPALDHALHEIAASINRAFGAELVCMSSFLLRIGEAPLPQMKAEITPGVVDGVKRYTTPHVVFSLSSEHARRIFMGADLWGDPALALRELFQNALDACRYRAARSKFIGVPYSPRIEMYHGCTNSGRPYVECRDNGIGMSRDVIAHCFAKAGNRFVNTFEFRKEMAEWSDADIEFFPNSQFGIGVFSYFVAADELEIETARLGCRCESPVERLHVSVPTASSFFRITNITVAESVRRATERSAEQGSSAISTVDSGTRVRLYLKSDGSQGVSILNTMREHVWYSEVHTEVRDSGGGVLVLEAEKLAPWLVGASEVSGSDVQFWWLLASSSARSSSPTKSLTTFRSRDDKIRYWTAGRVLVDGIATGIETPGFVVNLRGKHAPRLSLDRRDVRSRLDLDDLVLRATSHLPGVVTESFLEDLWNWDPRACHLAGNGSGRRWYEDRKECIYGDNDAEFHIRSRPYLPRVENDVFYVPPLRGYRDQWLMIWRLASDMPDARDVDTFILEGRGVRDVSGLSLNRIPSVVWDRLRQIELGVPEALALNFGFKRSQELLCVHVSWKSGESLKVCASRLNILANFMGIAWEALQCDLDYVVSDWDAWILSAGRVGGAWAGPEIGSVDVLRLCANTDMAIERAREECVKVAGRLGWQCRIEPSALEAGSILSSHTLAMYSATGVIVPSASDEEVRVLADMTGAAMPVSLRDVDADVVSSLSEEERIVVDSLRKRHARAGVLSLADACSVARAVPKPLKEAIGMVSACSKWLGLTCAWTPESEDVICGIGEQEWKVIDGERWIRDRVIKEHSAASMAAALSMNAYALHGVQMSVFHLRISDIHSAFGWGLPPLDADAMSQAVSLGYDAQKVLQRVSAGRAVIPSILLAAMENDVSVGTVERIMRTMGAFGVCVPRPDEDFVGLMWEEILGSDSDGNVS